MNLWKLGCRWGSGTPLFYEFIKENKIVIGWFGKNYQLGDWLLITDGYTVLSIAEVTSDRIPVLNHPEYKNDFQQYKIPFDNNIYLCHAKYINLTENDRFNYPLQQGIVQVQKQEYINKFNEKRKKYMQLESNIQIAQILKLKKQIILQGAPGTGKTYTTAALALSILGIDYDPTNHTEIMQIYKELENKQIFFTTFHQSIDYEDFVEGLKPEVIENMITYKVEDGIFKLVCQEAINKLGIADENDFDLKVENLKNECLAYQLKDEFLTLKTREGAPFHLKYEIDNENYFFFSPLKSTAINPRYYLSIKNIKSYFASNDKAMYYQSYIIPVIEYLNLKPVEKKQTLNYVLIIDEINRGNISKIFGELITLLEADKRSEGEHPLKVILPYSKESFEVPSNLYIIGTMNTTDRSVGHIDYAVRRRFAFYTLTSSKDAIESFYNRIGEGDLKVKALELFEGISDYIKVKKSPELDLEDLMVGHSYFMSKSIDELKLKLEYEIIPLLKEYEKDGLITLKEAERTELGQDWKKILS